MIVTIRALLLGGGVLALTACDALTGPSTGQVEYAITGGARHVSVTFQSASNETQQSSAQIPWTYQWVAKRGDRLFLSAQIDTPTDRGNITIIIKRNGVQYQVGSATGYPAIATVSGTF